MLKKDNYEEIIDLYEMMRNELILYRSYDKIVDFINNSKIFITEEEIKEYCLENSSKKMRKMILNGKYELDLSPLFRFKSEVSILRTNCQLLLDRLDQLMENKDEKDFSLKLGKLSIEIIRGVCELGNVVNHGNDPETYMKHNKIEKRKKEFPIHISSVLIAGAFIISYNLNTISYDFNNPYDGNQLTLSEDEINNIKKNLNSALDGKVPESSLGDENIDNYFLLNAVYENEQLDNEAKDALYDLISIIEDNPYLNKKESYNTLRKLQDEFKERPDDVSENVLAWFIPSEVKIEYFFDSSSPVVRLHIYHHESIHALFNMLSKNTPSFFTEGVTELLNKEYFSKDPYAKTYCYISEMATVKLLCDLVGSDKVLEAYTKGNMEIIYDALEEITGTREDAVVLISSLDRDFCIFNDNNLQLEFTDDTEKIFKQLNQYKEAKFNSEDNRGNITNKMNFDYNMSILRFSYNEDKFLEQYKAFIDQVGIIEKAYFYDELKNRSSNQIINYINRVKMIYPTMESNYNYKILEKKKR